MFKKVPYVINLYLVLFYFLFFGCSKKTNENINLKTGKEYSISFDYEKENPFEKKYINKVKIIGIKKGYVQFQYKDGFVQSCSIELFNKLVEK